MIRLWPDREVQVLKTRAGRVPLLVVRPKKPADRAHGVLWIHGGGYILGLKEMVYMSRAMDLVKHFGAVVVSPGYRLAWQKPYPAAIKDCYAALRYMADHAEEWGIDPERIMVGGESAGGGLAAAVCMLARDRKEIQVAGHMPLYPMLSNIDTESSKNNHGRVWNTRRNHIGWWFYLRGRAKKKVSPYASPAWQTDYKGLPPAYTFVGEGEPFYAETLQYVEDLRKAGVPAEVDVYPTNMHAFDMLQSKKELSRKAAAAFLEHFEKAMKRDSSKAPQDT